MEKLWRRWVRVSGARGQGGKGTGEGNMQTNRRHDMYKGVMRTAGQAGSRGSGALLRGGLERGRECSPLRLQPGRDTMCGCLAPAKSSRAGRDSGSGVEQWVGVRAGV